jgi:hypothetical protein
MNMTTRNLTPQMLVPPPDSGLRTVIAAFTVASSAVHTGSHWFTLVHNKKTFQKKFGSRKM